MYCLSGKSSTALYTNLFDAAGFTVSAAWNPWASSLAKSGDFTTILYSQVGRPVSLRKSIAHILLAYPVFICTTHTHLASLHLCSYMDLQALFGLISLVCMPLCMSRLNAKVVAEKKKD
jgi:hypothetical protein